MPKYLQNNPNADRMRLISQVAGGMAYLHRYKIIHGDIKPKNILVNDKHDACITDFGLSRILDVSGFTTQTVKGTYRWMAYELLAYELLGRAVPRITAASDIWAFGMTVLEVLTGRLPFYRLYSDSAVIISVVNGSRPQHRDYPEISDKIWLILEQCWDADLAQRPSMESLSVSLPLCV